MALEIGPLTDLALDDRVGCDNESWRKPGTLPRFRRGRDRWSSPRRGLVLRQSYQLKTLSGSATSVRAGENRTLTRTRGLLTALPDRRHGRNRPAGCRRRAVRNAPRQGEINDQGQGQGVHGQGCGQGQHRQGQGRQEQGHEGRQRQIQGQQVQGQEGRRAQKGTPQEREQEGQNEKKTAKGKKGSSTASISRSDETPDRRGTANAAPTGETALAQQAVAHARAGRTSQATSIQQSIQDPVTRKLIEWAILRSDGNGASSARYLAFINANPHWPSVGMMRRRAESMMWAEQTDPASVRAYFAKNPPLSSRGQFVLARAMLAQGDRAGAQAQVRDAWRTDAFGADLEARVIETFGGLLSAEDHKARMNMRLYADDVDGGLRNANRAGGDAAGHREGAYRRDEEGRQRQGRARRRSVRRRAATSATSSAWRSGCAGTTRRRRPPKLILSAPRDPSQTIDTDQWWIERRLNARNMLDLGDAAKAYRIARDAAVPKRDNYRAEHQFTAGWIALRFVKDPATALTHFAKIAERSPTAPSPSRVRTTGWAAPTRRRDATPRRGRTSRPRRSIPPPITDSSPARSSGCATSRCARRRRRASGPTDIVRAMELLYAVGQRDMVAGAAADLGDRSEDAGCARPRSAKSPPATTTPAPCC